MSSEPVVPEKEQPRSYGAPHVPKQPARAALLSGEYLGAPWHRCFVFRVWVLRFCFSFCLNMNENNNCVYQRANTTPKRLQPELHGVGNGAAFKSLELPKPHKHGRRTVS